MTFDVTGLIDFSPENNAWKLSLVTTHHPLINETKLLKQLLPRNNGNQTLKKLQHRYRGKLQRGTFRFDNYAFRQQYLKWIYAHFSDSLANHRMVQQDEQAFLLEWAEQFNQVHRHLKILWIVPQGNETKLIAHLLMIGLNFHHQQWSFDLKRAFEIEYHSDWPAAFYYFESNEGQRMAKVMQAELDQDIPDGRFQFSNVPLTTGQLIKLSPDFHPRATLPTSVKVHYHRPVKLAASISASRLVTSAKSYSGMSSQSQLSSLVSQSSSLTSQSSKNADSIASLTSGLSLASRVNSEFSMELKSCQKTKDQLSSRFKSLSARSKVSSEKLQSIRSLSSSAIRSQSLSDQVQDSSAAKSASLRSEMTIQSKSTSRRCQSYRSEILSSCHDYYRSLTSSVLASGHKSLSSRARSLKQKEKRSKLSHSLGAVYGISNVSNSASGSDNHYRQEIADNFSGSFDRQNFSNSFNKANAHHINYIPVIIIVSVIIIIVLIFVLPFLKL